MDYIGTNCPVCEEAFKQGDDIVVCPECGTPHHRHCYESVNHCVFQDKHREGFDYNAVAFGRTNTDNTENNNENQQANNDACICPRCKA